MEDSSAVHESEQGLWSADSILKTTFPEPEYVIPGILPAGLSFLAGAPKVGKSFLALQIAKEKASGGEIFGKRIQRGPVLYLALEDPPFRLQKRMVLQGWTTGLNASFMVLSDFQQHIHDLSNGGGKALASYVQTGKYSLVIIDTLSRAISGDQNDVHEMTAALSPLQEIAHNQNCAIVLIDHHRKPGVIAQDMISDILGSTAKGGVADTIIGLYRERGKLGAKLSVTGRDVEELTYDIQRDNKTGTWQLCEGDDGSFTALESELLEAIVELGPSNVTAIARQVGRNRGSVYKQLVNLESEGALMVNDKIWELAG